MWLSLGSPNDHGEIQGESTMAAIQTRVNEMLGIEHPILSLIHI